jgi:hypothetical protein
VGGDRFVSDCAHHQAFKHLAVFAAPIPTNYGPLFRQTGWLCSLNAAFLDAGDQLLAGALGVSGELPGGPVPACCPQLGIRKIGVCALRKAPVAK